MNTRIYNSIRFFLLCAVFLLPTSIAIAEESYHVGTIVQTATSFRWNNENWFTDEHPMVAEFTVRDDGSAYGMTETGVPFVQENVENMLNIRIQKFVLQDHYHFIIEGEVVYSLEDFSIQLAKAYTSSLPSST